MSAALFAVLHVAVGLNVAPTTATIIVVSTFVFGLIVGTLASVTGRLGGAIVAHIVFNGVAVWAQPGRPDADQVAPPHPPSPFAVRSTRPKTSAPPPRPPRRTPP